MISIADLNALNKNDAYSWFMQVCTASRWCEEMTSALPYSSKSALVEKAKVAWSEMQEQDFLEAFQGHPMIGDISSLREKYAATKALASNEQAGTSEADETTLASLHIANHEYLEKNGFIFIICASGLSADTMLNALQKRLSNSKAEEMAIAASEQLKISLIRIDKAVIDQLKEEKSTSDKSDNQNKDILND